MLIRRALLARPFAVIIAGLVLPGLAHALVGNNAEAVASDITSGLGDDRIVFNTQEALVPEDTDEREDIYVRYTPRGGSPVTELVSRDDSAPFAGQAWEAIGASSGVIYGHSATDGPAGVPPRTIFAFVRENAGIFEIKPATTTALITPAGPLRLRTSGDRITRTTKAIWVRGTAVEGNVFMRDILNDGSLVIETNGALVEGDRNGSCDLYRIPRPTLPISIRPVAPSTPQPELITAGLEFGNCPIYGGGFVAPSGDLRIIFSTDRLVLPIGDEDQAEDVFMYTGAAFPRMLSRFGGVPRSIELGSFLGTSLSSIDGDLTTPFLDDFGDAVSPEADAVAFFTAEPLLLADTDTAFDFYVARSDGTQVLVPGDGAPKLIRNGFVFFESKAPLAGNLDSDVDLFRMNLGTKEIVHVSRSRTTVSLFLGGPRVELGTEDVSFIGASDTGDIAWFRSTGAFGVRGQTVSANSDDNDDLYQANLRFAPGSARHLRRFTRSRAPAPGRVFGDPFSKARNTNSQANSMFLGRTVLFRSIRQLSAVESTGFGSNDIYASGPDIPGGLQLVTTVTRGAHPEEGVGDNVDDVIPSALGFGGTPFRAAFTTLQPDRGSDVFLVVFETDKRLAATDTDTDVDVYVRDLGTGTTLHVSTP